MKKAILIKLFAAMQIGIIYTSCTAVHQIVLQYDQQAVYVPLKQDSIFPVIKDSVGGFYDDFTNGIDPSMWLIAKMQWGGAGVNNGVVPENVSYTKDGILVLTGNGDFYMGSVEGVNSNGSIVDDGRRTGAVIVSKDTYGPGSFQIRMKVLPRLGACSAMWTYFNNEPINDEIDIEIPGNKSTFSETLFSNWLTDVNGISLPTVPKTPNNDGNWHIYRFDWHSNPPHIDYYVDGQVVLSNTDKIPTKMGRIWFGVWFPNVWNGNPNFDTGEMLVDWVKYTPFNEAGYEKTVIPDPPHASLNEYPKRTSPLPETNYISNAGFEVNTGAWSFYGKAKLVKDPGGTGSMVAQIPDENSMLSEIISSINPKFSYAFSAYSFVMKSGDKAIVTIECLDNLNFPISGGVFTLVSDNNAFKKDSVTFTTPDHTNAVKITLSKTGNGADIYFDDLSLYICD
jgi:beta-glucanase (GH16 family)